MNAKVIDIEFEKKKWDDVPHDLISLPVGCYKLTVERIVIDRMCPVCGKMAHEHAWWVLCCPCCGEHNIRLETVVSPSLFDSRREANNIRCMTCGQQVSKPYVSRMVLAEVWNAAACK